MRIFIDIGHPAHVHYFRNFIKIMERNGHKFCISARDKEITHSLFDYYQIQYTSKGRGRKSLLGKLFYLLKANYIIFKLARRFKPDICLSFGSPYLAHISKIIGKPHIAFDDTEHAKFEHLLYVPFSKCILTPKSFRKDFGKKHIRFDGSMDIAYLHPKYYESNINYLEELKLVNKIYFVLRFVEWSATHDYKQTGFSLDGKIKIIKLLSQYGQVIISSEGDLPNEFRKYLYQGDPFKIHTLIKYSSLFIGESGSMATEAAVLGTTAIIVNSSAKYFGVFEYISKFGNLFYYGNEMDAIEKLENLLSSHDFKQSSIGNAREFIRQTINVTDFMVWFLENYPDSFEIMKKNPDYQNNFRQ
jgi:predicted glycosyltransferase